MLPAMMASHEVIKQAVDEPGVKAVAAVLRVSPALVYKWCEPPANERDPDQSGAANPLDRVGHLYVVTRDIRLIRWICHKASGSFVGNYGQIRRLSLAEVTRVASGGHGKLMDLLTSAWADDGGIDPDTAVEIRMAREDYKSEMESFIIGCNTSHYLRPDPARRERDMEEFTGKLQRSGWDGDFLMVGTQLFESSAFDRLPTFDGHHPPILGLHWGMAIKLTEKPDGGIGGIAVERSWAKAALFRCIKHGGPTAVRRALAYRCSVCGHHDPLGEDVELMEETNQLWATASNLVQWRGR